MTSTEMENEFLILYDKITSFDAPGYDEEEISIFLTKAQERVFLDSYSSLKNRYREGFEKTEARRKELGPLVQGVTITVPSASQTNVKPNGTFFDLPADCLFVIDEEITVSSDDDCIDGKRISVKPITHDYYSLNINNPYKKPYEELAWRLDYQTKRHEIITDGNYTVTAYHIRYIKTLRPIIIGPITIDGVLGPADCQLDPIIHKRIIDEAVKIATATTTPEQYQIKSIEQKESE